MSERRYLQTRRAEQSQATRQRIVEALVALHGEIGPAKTTITAVAERAGVQRLTIYRHFADEAAMLQACSTHWAAGVPPPDPSRWNGVANPAERLRAALVCFYDYYARGESMLTHVFRDAPEVPALAVVLRPWGEFVAAVTADLAKLWKGRDGVHAARVAWIDHALRFDTWKSLMREGGLEAGDVVGAFVALVSELRPSSMGHGLPNQRVAASAAPASPERERPAQAITPSGRAKSTLRPRRSSVSRPT